MNYQVENLLNRFNRCNKENRVTEREVVESLERLGDTAGAGEIFDDIMSHRG